MRFPLKEVQSTRTQRPTSGSSYPYVEIMIGDLLNQRITQLQLEQVCVHSTDRERVDQTDAVRELCRTCRCNFSVHFTHLKCFVCVFSRAWSCAESLPCTWRTCCLSERRDSLCHQAKSPFCSTNTHMHTQKSHLMPH